MSKHAEKKKVWPFLQAFNHISPRDLEEILEWLQDSNYLSDKGKMFKYQLDNNIFAKPKVWNLFIKVDSHDKR